MILAFIVLLHLWTGQTNEQKKKTLKLQAMGIFSVLEKSFKVKKLRPK